TEDLVRPIRSDRAAAAVPVSDEAAVQAAVESSTEIRRLQSQIASKQLGARGQRAQRWPRIDLVAQYGLFAKFNHYEDYFRTFQRNNGQLGVSFQVPLFTGPGMGAQMSQTQTEISHLKVELGSARNRISASLQQSFRDVKKAET